MDGALSSSRSEDNNNGGNGNSNSGHYQHNHHYNNNRPYHQRRDHNRRGRGGYHHNNRRGGRGGYNNDRRYHHQPYHRGGGRGRGGGGYGGRNRSPGNRFDNSTATKSVDPQTAMLKQLTAMVAKMGDLIECAKSIPGDSSNIGNGVEAGTEISTTTSATMTRGVVKAVARNIQDLVLVLCSTQNAPMFLKFTPPVIKENGEEGTGMDSADGTGTSANTSNQQSAVHKIKAEEEAGPLANLIASCAATLPLQSPSYVGLTLGVEEHAPDLIEDAQVTSYKGFAKRCITMVCRRIASDLDKTCGVTYLLDAGQNTSSEGNEAFSGDTFVDAFMRSKLLLRYLSLLARAGIVSGFDELKDNADDEIEDGGASSTQTVAGVLKLLTVAAVRANDAAGLLDNTSNAAINSFKNTSILLCALVLSTIPYTVNFIPQTFTTFLMDQIESILKSYKSTYQPGAGMMAILLEKEIKEESILKEDDGDASDEEDDDDDDDNDDESTPPCADTFQDLLRTVRKVVESFYATSTKSTRFALLSDSPWLHLKAKEQEYAPMEGDEEDAMLKQKQEDLKLEYSGEEILITFDSCILLSYLFSLGGGSDVSDMVINGVSISTTVALQCPTLEGIVFGRISVFDPPPDDDDEEEEDEQPENPEVEAYVKTFSLMDRYFLSEAVRDCLVCHKSSVSSSGLEKGTCKDVAEQLWGVCYLFQPANNGSESTGDDDKNNLNGNTTTAKGVEYGIVETILSLIIQCPRDINTSSPLSHIYLSRVLIELTKNQPSLVPQSLAVAVAHLFNDFVPSMSPLAKHNMSQWLAFHLANTDYQWPRAYWDLWTPYVVQGMDSSESANGQKRNCRGEFVTNAIQCMAHNLSSPELLVKDCLPMHSQLCNYIIGSSRGSVGEKSSVIEDIQKDLTERIWIQNEDPENIRDYIIGDEVSESVQNDIDDGGGSTNSDVTWWRTGLVVRSLLRPAVRDKNRFERLLKEAQGDEMITTSMDDEWEPKEDVLTDVGDILPRYKPVILATVAQDIRVHEENLDLRGETKKSESDMILSGEIFVLQQCELLLSYSSVIMKACIDLLVSHEVVSPKAVISWSICGSTNEIESANPIVSGWWNYASSAARLGVGKIMSNDGSDVEMLSTDVGMIIDTGGDEDDAKAATPSIRRMKKVAEYIKPLMRFTSNCVRKVLETDDPSGKLSHEGADLKEGLKHFTRSLLSYAKVSLKQDSIVKATTELGGPALEVEIFLANNDMCS